MRVAAVICTLMGLTLGGCQAPGAEAVENPLPVASGEYDWLYDAAQKVLRDRGYRINHASYRYGRIDSEPRVSPTMVEPWHGDNVTFARATQSTLRHLRRQVTVTLQPVPSPEQHVAPGPASQREVVVVPESPGELYELRVTVTVEAEQRPRRRLIRRIERGGFSRLAETPAEWQRRGIPGRYWLVVDRDRPLERQLIQQIVREAYSF